MHTMKKTLLTGAAVAALSFGAAGTALAGYDANSRLDALEAEMRELKAQIAARDAQILALENREMADLSGLPKFNPNKLGMESRDGQFSMELGGRLQLDGGCQFGDGNNSFGGNVCGAEIRRARLYVKGKVFGDWKYKMNFDFAGGGASPVDVYIERDFGNLTWRIGHFNPYISIEDQTSNKYITFNERSMLNDFVGPSETLGTGISYSDDKFYGLEAGLFLNGDNAGAWDNATFDTGLGPANWNGQGRLWFAPINESGPDGMNLHLGVGGAYNSLEASSTMRFRARPMYHLSNRIIDTGNITGASDWWTIVPEAAFRYGPFNLEAEYAFIQLNGNNLGGVAGGDAANYVAYYVQGSFFLNGYRNYSVSGGDFGRPKVEPGAIQLAVMYGYANNEDQASGVNGLASPRAGNAYNITGGINYYWNKYVVTKLNYTYANAEYMNGNEEDIQNVVMRWQIDF